MPTGNDLRRFNPGAVPRAPPAWIAGGPARILAMMSHFKAPRLFAASRPCAEPPELRCWSSGRPNRRSFEAEVRRGLADAFVLSVVTIRTWLRTCLFVHLAATRACPSVLQAMACSLP